MHLPFLSKAVAQLCAVVLLVEPASAFASGSSLQSSRNVDNSTGPDMRNMDMGTRAMPDQSYKVGSPGVSSEPVTTGNDPVLASELLARDQALLIAIHNGGRAMWTSVTASDFFYMEEGELQPRKVFLDGLVPDSQRGLVIRDYELNRFGDTALVLHHAVVRRDDRDPRASQPQLFVTTEAWTRVGAEWKLHVLHIDAVKTSPPSITLTVAQMAELTGTYRRGAAILEVQRVDDHLAAKRQGQAEIRLGAETRDVLFDPDELRGRYIFRRDDQGNVTALVMRFENADSVWVRQPAGG
jgi:hypothetical protein